MSSSEEDDDRPIAYDRLAPLGGLGLPVLGLGLPATAAAPVRGASDPSLGESLAVSPPSVRRRRSHLPFSRVARGGRVYLP